jgi:hypothetical protein
MALSYLALRCVRNVAITAPFLLASTVTLHEPGIPG